VGLGPLPPTLRRHASLQRSNARTPAHPDSNHPHLLTAARFRVLDAPVSRCRAPQNRQLCIEDQLLRALGTGDNKVSNPKAYQMRRMFQRMYYNYKPGKTLWIIVIIGRKMGIAITSLLFVKNPGFQMAVRGCVGGGGGKGVSCCRCCVVPYMAGVWRCAITAGASFDSPVPPRTLEGPVWLPMLSGGVKRVRTCVLVHARATQPCRALASPPPTHTPCIPPLQMALLVLFVAYSLQVRHNPYMSTGERAEVVEKYRQKTAKKQYSEGKYKFVAEVRPWFRVAL
jgi:hypothetical protein